MAGPVVPTVLGMDTDKYFHSFLENFHSSELFVMLQFVVKNIATEEQKQKIREDIIKEWDASMNLILERELKIVESISNDKSSNLITSIKENVTKIFDTNRKMVYKQMNERLDKIGL